MNKLWVHFNLLCDGDAQRRLHKIFRHKVRDWEKQGAVKGTVLTYHFHTPSVPTDSLYVCLDIPAVELPHKRSVELSNETIEQIPWEIMSSIERVCDEKQVRLKIRDYEFGMIQNKSWRLYRNAPVEEILRFASIGTKIALQILDLMESDERPWTSHGEFANFILSQLKKDLGESYFWLREAFHFVCNPALLNEAYLWTLVAPP